MNKTTLFVDLRANNRFDVHRPVEYRIAISGNRFVTGSGRTINVASGGVLFTTEHQLPPGAHVEVTIDWPAKIDGKCAIQLVASGRVIRSDRGSTAVRILRYEFKTRGTTTA